MRASGLFWSWVYVLHALIALSTLSACTPYLEQTQPLIVLDPDQGGPGTSVTIIGSGFPGKVQVSVRLGPPSVGATPLSYGDVDTDASGGFVLSFTMPSHWPDGTPITETGLVVVVLNQDGSTKATAAFEYLPSPSKAPVPRLRFAEEPPALILAWHRESDIDGSCGDLTVYESGYIEIAPCDESAGAIERRQLSREAVDQLHGWVTTYKAFEIEQVRRVGPSRIRTRTFFAGNGTRQVSETQLQMIQALLETLVAAS